MLHSSSAKRQCPNHPGTKTVCLWKICRLPPSVFRFVLTLARPEKCQISIWCLESFRYPLPPSRTVTNWLLRWSIFSTKTSAIYPESFPGAVNLTCNPLRSPFRSTVVRIFQWCDRLINAPPFIVSSTTTLSRLLRWKSICWPYNLANCLRQRPEK